MTKHEQPTDRITFNRTGGYAGMTDGEIMSWAQYAARRMLIDREHDAVIEAVERGQAMMCLHRPVRIEVNALRRYEGARRGWRIDRNEDLTLELYGREHVRHVILQPLTDNASPLRLTFTQPASA